jgi:hypothetical protein
MQHIFADAVTSVIIANGIARIELAQVVRGPGSTKTTAEPVARLIVPAGALKDVAAKLDEVVHRIEQAQATKEAGLNASLVEAEDPAALP